MACGHSFIISSLFLPSNKMHFALTIRFFIFTILPVYFGYVAGGGYFQFKAVHGAQVVHGVLHLHG